MLYHKKALKENNVRLILLQRKIFFERKTHMWGEMMVNRRLPKCHEDITWNVRGVGRKSFYN